MEYAQALILTNALGGLSSLGQASTSKTGVQGRARAWLGPFVVKFCIFEDTIRIRLFEGDFGVLGARSTTPKEILGSELEEMLPGRLIVASEHKYLAFPLLSMGDHLVACLSTECPPQKVALELLVDGVILRSNFVHAEPCEKGMR